MTQEQTTISPLFSTPYITIAEYKQAPTAVDVDDLVGGGSQGVNDQELANCVARASSWIDAHCGQVLSATKDTDSFRTRISRDGMLKVHPRFTPIVAVVSASYGIQPDLMQDLDPTTAWIEYGSVVFPLSGTAASFFGALGFSRNYKSTSEQFFTITYINGYANTLLASNAASGVSTLSVKDLSGFQPNHQYQIYDGSSSELITVASSFTPTTGAGSLTLASATSYAHNSGVSVSGLPPAIKQAAIYMTNVILKSRGNSAIVMGGLSPNSIESDNPAVSNDYSSAMDILKPYRRIR